MKTKTMAVVVPIMGELHRSKPYWGLLTQMTSGADLIVIDNGAFQNPDDRMHNPQYFIENFVRPFWDGQVYYDPQENNLGVPKTMQYVYENYPHDILCFLHNDVYIYQAGWTARVLNLFENEDNTGLVGFFGAEGIHPGSGRFEVYSNMLEAEFHGHRLLTPYREVAVLDGMSMFASRKMLDAGDGVDVGFIVHHFYDLDLSLESIKRGYRNFVINAPVHHQSGQTACMPVFQDWAKDIVPQGEQGMYQLNLERWRAKWSAKLPWKVGDPPLA